MEIQKKNPANHSERLRRLKKTEELTWPQMARKLRVSTSLLMLVNRGDRQLTEKVMVRLEWAEVEAGFKDESEISEAARELGRKLRPIRPEITIDDVEKGSFQLQPDYVPDAPKGELSKNVKLRKPQPEAVRRLGVIVAKSFDFDIVLLACLEPKLRSRKYLKRLDIGSLESLRDAAMALVFGMEWQTAVANLAVDYRVGDSSEVERILGDHRNPL